MCYCRNLFGKFSNDKSVNFPSYLSTKILSPEKDKIYNGESIRSIVEEYGQGALEYIILTATGLAVIATGALFMRKIAVESNLKSERAYGNINQSIEEMLDEIVDESGGQTAIQAQSASTVPSLNTTTSLEESANPSYSTHKCWVCGPTISILISLFPSFLKSLKREFKEF